MNPSRAMLKADAKAAIHESKTSPYLTAFIFVLIVYVLGLLQSNIAGIAVNYDSYINALETGNYSYLYDVIQQRPRGMASIIDMLLSLMSAMIGIGFTIFTLNVSRRLDNSVGNLFDGFGNFFRFVWLNILIALLITMWSLTFIILAALAVYYNHTAIFLLFMLAGAVLALIAAYRYRQAVYILIDNPKMRPIDCIRKSKEMMRGHKAELFMLDLSFLGWVLLTIIPFVSIYVYPYTQTTFAGYYDSLLSVEKGYYQRPSSDLSGPSSGPTGYAADKEDELPPWEYKD
ncbi:MAG: DUF975 family protein [Clostridia bacterium]|nr:DUF975 family protein [Clostridia bacterium]